MPPAIELARRYAEALAALRAVHDFDEWIGHFWQEACPAPPSAPRRATRWTPEDTIVWHEGEETVFGYLPGREGCFCVPRDVALPDFPLVAENPALPFGPGHRHQRRHARRAAAARKLAVQRPINQATGVLPGPPRAAGNARVPQEHHASTLSLRVLNFAAGARCERRDGFRLPAQDPSRPRHPCPSDSG